VLACAAVGDNMHKAKTGAESLRITIKSAGLVLEFPRK
jgi:hypothetical protein